MRQLPSNVVYDLSIFVMIIFVFAISSVLAITILNGLNDGFQANSHTSQEAKDVGESMSNKFPSLFDALIVFAFVGVWLFLIVSMALLDTHPVFFVIALITTIAVFVVSAVFQDAFTTMSGMDTIGSVASSMPMTTWIMGHLLYLFVFVVATVMISLYGNIEGGGMY